tara:strand:+ start:804 stop:1160 length:357 start_codon:yes stop_codon:yes gene_type:complete
VVAVEPVPASRPRVTKWGTYYGKRYTQFRKDAKAALDAMELGEPFAGRISVHLEFWCKRPKTTKRETPRGDIDNYIKAILDSCNAVVWDDDDQITKCSAKKMFEDEHGPRIIITIFTP